MPSEEDLYPKPTDRYFFIARDAAPYLHLESDCWRIDHTRVDRIATASIPRWMAHWMHKCDNCVPDEHRQVLKEAWQARHEEYKEDEWPPRRRADS